MIFLLFVVSVEFWLTHVFEAGKNSKITHTSDANGKDKIWQGTL